MNTHRFSGRLSALWNFLRQLATDDAYERYLTHHEHTHAHTQPLGRRAFYEREQQRKWNDIKRCC
jgi:uncharacterized short protein YbdD (DUF466 family)